MADVQVTDMSGAAETSFGARQFGHMMVWVSMAVAAILGVTMAARSDVGARRITVALGWAPDPQSLGGGQDVQIARASTPGTEEIRRLSDRLRALSARLEILERSADVTASVPSTSIPRSDRLTIVATPNGPPSTVERVVEPSGPSTRPAGTPSGPDSVQPNPAPPASSAPATQDGGELLLTKTDFGIDLGSEASLDGLRRLWTTIKAQHGALLEGSRPVVAVRDSRLGATELHLIVGPFSNASAAARLCIVIGLTGRNCQPAVFEGQRLALN